MVSPSPVPGWALTSGSSERKNSRNSWIRSAGAIPMPWSWQLSTTHSSSRDRVSVTVESAAGVLHRVAEQVGDHDVQLGRVAGRDELVVVALEGHLDPALVGDRGEVHDVVHHVGQVHRHG